MRASTTWSCSARQPAFAATAFDSKTAPLAAPARRLAAGRSGAHRPRIVRALRPRRPTTTSRPTAHRLYGRTAVATSRSSLPRVGPRARRVRDDARSRLRSRLDVVERSSRSWTPSRRTRGELRTMSAPTPQELCEREGRGRRVQRKGVESGHGTCPNQSQLRPSLRRSSASGCSSSPASRIRRRRGTRRAVAVSGRPRRRRGVAGPRTRRYTARRAPCHYKDAPTNALTSEGPNRTRKIGAEPHFACLLRATSCQRPRNERSSRSSSARAKTSSPTVLAPPSTVEFDSAPSRRRHSWPGDRAATIWASVALSERASATRSRGDPCHKKTRPLTLDAMSEGPNRRSRRSVAPERA